MNILTVEIPYSLINAFVEKCNEFGVNGKIIRRSDKRQSATFSLWNIFPCSAYQLGVWYAEERIGNPHLF
jgi:hypothetical protein